MEKISYADGTAQNSGMGSIGHSMESANIDETTAKSNSKKEKNHTKKLRQGTANKIKRNANLSNLSKSSAANILEPFRLIMGRENGFSQSHDQNIAWAHRTILGPTSHSSVQWGVSKLGFCAVYFGNKHCLFGNTGKKYHTFWAWVFSLCLKLK
jgi:hypothetical protein